MSFDIDQSHAGKRLDVVLAQLYPDYSRSRLQSWLKQGLLTLDGKPATASFKVRGGERVELSGIPETDASEVEAQNIPLDIVHQDEHLLVIDKPAGLVMHPAAGNPDNTVQNGLLHFDPELVKIPRAGIVHRLDKDTTGLFVVARTLKAHQSLVSQLQERSMGRRYLAIVHGHMVSGGSIDQPIGRHPRDRKRMAVVKGGKEAVTHYRIQQKFTAHTALQVKLESGRTHQIRVHMSHLNHPLVGDTTYGGRPRYPAGLDQESRDTIGKFARQALHAFRLDLQHPDSGERLSWQREPPEDMQQLLSVLQSTDSNRPQSS